MNNLQVNFQWLWPSAICNLFLYTGRYLNYPNILFTLFCLQFPYQCHCIDSVILTFNNKIIPYCVSPQTEVVIQNGYDMHRVPGLLQGIRPNLVEMGIGYSYDLWLLRWRYDYDAMNILYLYIYSIPLILKTKAKSCYQSCKI